ncbi:MAG TPA: FGLLP motif-containing membrane protein [Frankiaceae bacterium]|jgi:hypothetical protein|nr:FGLLP motif-containing membrane protein [Frankiaceae bacterium]
MRHRPRLLLALAVPAALAAVAALAGPAGTASARAAGSGVVAFTRDPDGPGGPAEPTVYVAGVDGSGERAYTSGSAPALARDPGRIAFSRRVGGATQLFTARLDAAEAPRQVTRLPDREAEFGPGRYGVAGSVWSPSLTRIALRLMEGSTTTLGLVDAEGSGDVTRLEFGHLFGSRIAWRDDDSLAVGTDTGLMLVTADGKAAPVKGAAQGDTPVAWVDDGLAVNGSDGIAVVDPAAGTRELLVPGATAWDTYLDTGLLATRDSQVLLSTPNDGPGTEPSVLGTLPAGAQVVGGAGGRSVPLLELADASGESAIWTVPGGGAPVTRLVTGSDLTLNDTLRLADVVVPNATPAPPGTFSPPAEPGPAPANAPELARTFRAAAPGPVDPPPGRSTFAHAVPSSDEVSLDTRALLVNALVTALLMLLIAFPSELFNNTLEQHYDEVRGWFGRRGPRKPAVERPRGLRVVTFGAYAAAAAVLYALLDRDASFDGRTARLWLGLLAGIVVVTLVFSAATLRYHRARGSRGAIEVLPGTLLVAVACVVVSRVTGFEPGYMYGILGGFAFAKALPARDEGRAATLSAAWVLVAALLAWLVWLPVNDAVEDGNASLLMGLLDTTLAAIAVGGVQGLVIGLLPLRSLQGHTIARWDRRVWATVYGLVMFVFVHLLLHPSSGFGGDAAAAPFWTWLGLFAGFGVVSVAFWGYFARRPSSG